MPTGEEVYRVIGDDCRFLGCAFTTNPAAAVQGVLSVDYRDFEEIEEELEEETEEPPVVDRRKSNAMARSLSVMLSSKKDDTSKCYLCLMDYATGDEVAFSKNEKCTHRYHKDCIVEWSMKRTACPCCREEVIESNTL